MWAELTGEKLTWRNACVLVTLTTYRPQPSTTDIRSGHGRRHTKEPPRGLKPRESRAGIWARAATIHVHPVDEHYSQRYRAWAGLVLWSCWEPSMSIQTEQEPRTGLKRDNVGGEPHPPETITSQFKVIVILLKTRQSPYIRAWRNTTSLLDSVEFLTPVQFSQTI